MYKYYIFTGRVYFTEVYANSEAGALDNFRKENPDTKVLFIETEEEFDEMNDVYLESFNQN